MSFMLSCMKRSLEGRGCKGNSGIAPKAISSKLMEIALAVLKKLFMLSTTICCTALLESRRQILWCISLNH